MNKLFLQFAAVTGALAVMGGALLAHRLKQIMPEAATQVYETAVRFQFYHVFALLACGILSEKFHGSAINRAGTFFILGILLFCGSLYIIAALMTNGIYIPIVLGMLTPLGGIAFMSGWIFLSLAVRNGRNS